MRNSKIQGKLRSLVIILLLFCGWMLTEPAVALATDWPMPQKDVKNTAFTSDFGPTSNTILWQVDLDKGTDACTQPIVAENKVFVRAGRELFSINKNTGEVLEKRIIGFGGEIAYDEGHLYVPGERGYLYCLSADDLSEKWSKKLAGEYPVFSSPRISDNIVYFGFGGPFAIQKDSGDILWKDKDTFADSTGYPKSHTNMQGLSFAIANGKLYWPSQEHWTDGWNVYMTEYLHWSDLQHGNSQFGYVRYPGDRIGGVPQFTPTVGDDHLYYITRGRIEKRSLSDLSLEESMNLGGIISHCPAYHNKVLFVRRESGLCAVNTDTMTVKWEFNTPLPSYGAVRSAAAISGNGIVYFGTMEGKIYAVDEERGSLIWEYDAGSSCSSPAISDGVLYIACGNILYAFKGALLFYLSPSVIKRGEVVKITGKIYPPVEGETVTFKICNADCEHNPTGEWKDIGSTTTNAEGMFEFSYEVSQEEAGEYLIKASYAGLSEEKPLSVLELTKQAYCCDSKYCWGQVPFTPSDHGWAFGNWAPFGDWRIPFINDFAFCTGMCLSIFNNCCSGTEGRIWGDITPQDEGYHPGQKCNPRQSSRCCRGPAPPFLECDITRKIAIAQIVVDGLCKGKYPLPAFHQHYMEFDYVTEEVEKKEYERLKKFLWAGMPVLLYIGSQDWSHAVVAYKLWENECRARVFVYDPNIGSQNDMYANEGVYFDFNKKSGKIVSNNNPCLPDLFKKFLCAIPSYDPEKYDDDIESLKSALLEDIGTVLELCNFNLLILGFCPIDLIVIDPQGNTISKETSTIENAHYVEFDANDDGELEPAVLIPKQNGNYQIFVIPRADSQPTDTFSLFAYSSDEPTNVITLAENVPISDIPAQPYIIESTEEGIKKKGAIQGDLDHDGDVDQDDLNILLTYRNQPATECPECDLDGDGVITVLDARKLVLLCTRPRCATE